MQARGAPFPWICSRGPCCGKPTADRRPPTAGRRIGAARSLGEGEPRIPSVESGLRRSEARCLRRRSGHFEERVGGFPKGSPGSPRRVVLADGPIIGVDSPQARSRRARHGRPGPAPRVLRRRRRGVPTGLGGAGVCALLVRLGFREYTWIDQSSISGEYNRRRADAAPKATSASPLRPPALLGPGRGTILANQARNLEEDRVRVMMGVWEKHAPERESGDHPGGPAWAPGTARGRNATSGRRRTSASRASPEPS